MFKRTFWLVVLVVALTSPQLHAQSPFGLNANAKDGEIGLTAGVTGYQGDLAEQAISLDHAFGGGGLFFRYHMNKRHALRFFGNIMVINGEDSKINTEEGQLARSVPFRNQMTELGVTYQFNLLPFIGGVPRYAFGPYLFAGAAYLAHNPEGELFDTWYELEPIQTEGAGYNTNTFAIPYGVGINYSLGRSLINIGVELSHRFTFTDRLDDVSDTHSEALTELASGSGRLGGAVKRQLILSAPSVLEDYPQASQLSDIPDEAVREAARQKAGNPRGNPERNDAYWYLGFTVSKSIRRMF